PLRDIDCLPVNSGVGQMAVMRGITKWSVQVPHISRLADLLGLAIRKAKSGRPGPVYVDLPIAVAFAEIDEAQVRYLDGAQETTRPAPTQAAVAAI
ncbi:thiamine pyrophosphate-binding protein, partial [Vibrio parahaemolyticus]|nr:thiamine pyrophosphate-binding protein [Vibrio parahaemolyticus]